MRPTRLAGLFLFEFTVVLLGVLAAQAVADWAEDRRLLHEAEMQYTQARDQAIELARVHAYWAKVAPCLADRARGIARLAADGGTLSAADIGRPALPTVRMPAWDPDVRRVAYARYGKQKMDAIAGLEVAVMVTIDTSIRIREGWSKFALLDPRNGTSSDADRANVRLAAIGVIDYVRVLGSNTPSDEMEILSVPRAEWETVDLKAQGLDDCGLILNWQR